MTELNELAVMKEIDELLSNIKDQDTKNRILVWANSKYGDPKLTQQLPPAQSPSTKKKRTQSKTPSKKTKQSLSQIKDLDTSPSGKQSLKEFVFLQNTLANLISQTILFLPKLIAGFFVLIVFYLFYRLLRFIIHRSLKKADISTSLINLITKIVKYFCLGIAFMLVADQIGIKIIG